MTRLGRVGVSFACTVISVPLVCIIASLPGSTVSRVWANAVGVSAYAFLLAIPGWIFALPAVLLIDPVGRRQVLRMAAIGTLIGPLGMWLMFSLVVVGSGHPFRIPFREEKFWDLVLLALAVSATTTVFYLVGVTMLERRRRPL